MNRCPSLQWHKIVELHFQKHLYLHTDYDTVSCFGTTGYFADIIQYRANVMSTKEYGPFPK